MQSQPRYREFSLRVGPTRLQPFSLETTMPWQLSYQSFHWEWGGGVWFGPFNALIYASESVEAVGLNFTYEI